jgi:hypothetical protein
MNEEKPEKTPEEKKALAEILLQPTTMSEITLKGSRN